MKPFLPLPKEIEEVMHQITKEGYCYYLVGGAIRDFFMKQEAKDYDLCTNIPFSLLLKLFPKLVIMKENEHRKAAILRKEGITLEFSMLKKEDIYEDLKERDFTINAMAVDRNGTLIDPFDGKKDSKKKILSLVKEDGSSLIVDPLRILRAIRFASNYQLTIDDNTKKQLLEKRSLLKTVKKERIYKELKEILVSSNIEFYLMEYKEIFFEIIKELRECDQFHQHNDYHIYDVYQHIVKVVKHTEENFPLRLAALFHDIGKLKMFYQDDKKVGHFYQHEKVSNDIFLSFAKEYKIDKKTKKIVSLLILNHDKTLSMKDGKIYDFYQNFPKDKIELLFALKKADILSQNPKYIDRLKELEQQKEKYIEIRNLIESISYNGYDLIKLGYQNNEIGKKLEEVKRLIVTKRLENEKEKIDFYLQKKNIEYVDVFDKNGNYTGQVMERKKVQNLQLPHFEVVIFLVNSKREILLQKRSPQKKYYPNKWAPCAGGVKSGETREEAAIRELKEELGVKFSFNDLKILEDKDTFTRIYYVMCKKEETEFKLQKEEVSCIKWFLIDDIITRIQKKDGSIILKEEKIPVLKKLENIVFD